MGLNRQNLRRLQICRADSSPACRTHRRRTGTRSWRIRASAGAAPLGMITSLRVSSPKDPTTTVPLLIHFLRPLWVEVAAIAPFAEVRGRRAEFGGAPGEAGYVLSRNGALTDCGSAGAGAAYRSYLQSN